MTKETPDTRAAFGLSRRAYLLATTAILHATITGSSLAASPQPAETANLKGVKLRVGIFHQVTYLQIKLTDHFEGTPYDIEWVRLNGAGGTMQALGGGAIDLSWGLSDVAVPNAAALDKEPWTAATAPLKHIALLRPLDAAKFPTHIIVAHKDAGVRTIADARGKTYTYQEGGNSAATALLALQQAGLTKDDVRITRIQADSIPAAVISGAVAVATVQGPQIQEALDDGTVIRLASGFEAGFPGYTSITARTASIEDPKISAAIADFLTRATAFSLWRNAHIEETAQTYVKAQQLNADQASRAASAGASTILPFTPGGEAVTVQTDLQKRLHASGFLAKPVDYSALYDDRFSDAIIKGQS